jgi:NADH-quinone oxidoreductase subunit L
MGALKNKMPITFLTFAIGTLSLTGCPGLAGFFSKDAILFAARDRSPALFFLALITAFLTAFYMFRLFSVVFFGRAKSDASKHGHEGSGVMTLPLLILAVPSAIAGYGFFAGRFLDLPPEEAVPFALTMLPVLAFLFGAGFAWVLYARKDEDPIHIPLFANKFYFDEIYAWLIRYTHDALAAFCAWFDHWVLDGAVIRGFFGGGTWGTGFALRFFQIGNLQAYTFLFGVGVATLIYFMVFK